jgi:hypothetical protein
MKLDVGRYSIKLYPENETEEAYMEEVLGLKEAGASIKLVRKNAMGLGCIAYLRTYTQDQEELNKEVV